MIVRYPYKNLVRKADMTGDGSDESWQVGFNDGTETMETEEDPDSGPKRSAHGRKATAFVPKARAAPGVWSSNLIFFVGFFLL